MRLLIAVLILCLSGFCEVRAQERLSTSELEKQLDNADGKERIELLLQLSGRTEFSDAGQALSYAREALDLSKGYSQDSLEAESMLRIGSVNGIQADFVSGIPNLKAAAEKFEVLGYENRKATAANILSSMYMDLGEYKTALEHYYKSLEHYQQQDNTNGEIFVYTRIGMVQRELGDYQAAKRFFHDAIHLAREEGNWGAETIALSEAGFLEEKEGNIEKALEYFNKALRLFKEHNSNHGVASLMYSIARLYQNNERLEEALLYNQRAVALADSLGNDFFAIDGLVNIAGVYREQGKFHESNKVLFEAIKRAEASGIRAKLMSSNIMVSANYQSLGNYNRAADYAMNAKLQAVEAGDLEKTAEALEILINAYLSLGEYQEAITFQQELMTTKDSILNKETAKQVAEMEARYRVSEQERAIEKLQEENEQRSIIQLAILIGFGLSIIIGFLVIRGQRLKIKKSETDLENNLLKQRQLEQELDFKNKQLTTQSLNLVQKNEMMLELREKVEDLKKEGTTKELNSLSHLVDYSFSLDEDWKQFQMHFEEVHSGFYHILKERFPDMTPNDMKLCALAKLNLNIKEMAAILGISPDSVKTARYRLRKKLNLKTEANLTDFMLELEKEAGAQSDSL